jgi:hypothetical protein
LIDTFQWGASHDVPITLSLPSLGPFQIAPSFSFRERWFAQKFFRAWNPVKEKLDSTIEKGFYAAREMNMGLSFSTAVFGTFQAKKKEARVQAIRHVMRPQFSVNYKPDLMKPYYYRQQVDKQGNRVLMSVFDGSIFGPFGSEENGGIGFGIDNNIEMKVRSKTDTSKDAEFKKVKLIDGFGVSGGYNMLADSFKLSTFNFYARSSLLETINITANMTMDPYKSNPQTGYRMNQYIWSGGGKFDFFSSLVSGSVNISTSLQSKKKKDGGKQTEKKDEAFEDNLTQEQMNAQLDFIRRNPAEFTDFSIPWTMSFSYSLSFAKLPQPDYTFKNEFTSNFNFNGDFSLTPKWKIGANGYFDVETGKLQSLTTFVSRDLHCWQMSINITPIGLYKFFNISINPKSGLLRDLKINRTRYFYTQ